MSSKSARALVACFTAVVLGAGISACGSSSGSTGTTNGTSGTQFQARLNLARCFRSHGINVPDPSPGGGAAEGGGAFRILQQYSQTQVQAATQACQQYFRQAFPRLNLSPAQQAQFRQQFVRFAQCMRSHGIDIPDPTTGTNGFFGLRKTFGSIDRNSPAFKSAMTACQSLRPQFGRGGPGGGPQPGAQGA